MRPRPPEPPGSFAAAGLHLAALCGFALGQPIFDVLGRNAPFFAVRGSSRWDLVVFASGLVLIPPLALLGLEGLAGLARRAAATALHLLLVAVLAGVVCLQAIRGVDAEDALLVAASAVAGAIAATLYTLVRPARSLLSVLAAAPILFVALFLLVSPASRLVTASAPAPRLANVASRTPVVLVVFDELPTVSLLDERGGIDAVRYPNFARLARDGIWFRNATTVHEWTTSAVPAILTGLEPEPGTLPLYLDHPDNLFTLLGESYDLRVVETQAHLCPAELCGTSGSFGARLRSTVSDVSVLYPHLVLPDGFREHLTPIAEAWSGFRHTGGRPAAYLDRDGQARRFVQQISSGRRPRLFFLHVLLPHHPWEYLPDGKRYSSALPWQPGLVDDRWTGDPELALQAEQRHLLQLGFTDRVLGWIVARLKAKGLYDDALVVATADHGVSFRPGGERRRANRKNLADIAFVPLVVKLPHGRERRVEDAHVQTIDILPMIADVLGVRVPWRTDGRSALRVRRDGEREVHVYTAFGERVGAGVSELVRRRDALLRRKLEFFGAGERPPGLFRIGPQLQLLGRQIDGLAARRAGGPRVRLLGETAYDPSSAVVPVHVAGILIDAAEARDVAVAVNGRIAAVTSSYRYSGKTWFSAILPEESFRPGSNEVRIFLVEESGSSMRLVEALSDGS